MVFGNMWAALKYRGISLPEEVKALLRLVEHSGIMLASSIRGTFGSFSQKLKKFVKLRQQIRCQKIEFCVCAAIRYHVGSLLCPLLEREQNNQKAVVFRSTFKMGANRVGGQFLPLEPSLGFFLRNLDPHSFLPNPRMRLAPLSEAGEGGLSVWSGQSYSIRYEAVVSGKECCYSLVRCRSGVFLFSLLTYQLRALFY